MADVDPPEGRFDDDYEPEEPLRKVLSILETGAEWRSSLVKYTDKDGTERISGTAGNLALFLLNDPEWSGCLGYNEFSEREIWLKNAPPMLGLVAPQAGQELCDEHDTYVQHWFHRAHGFNVRSAALALGAAARAASFHPVRSYLRGLVWDGKVRLRSLLSGYFGAPDTEYTAEVGARWAVSAVARVMRPGCQADSMLIIEGNQGKGKSTGLEALAGKDWFADTPLDLKSKNDAYQALRGKWIYEIAELDAFRGQDITRIKTFISARVDNYRASYGRRNRDYPRQTIFAGSTNEDHYLQDRTGNRRFWPVKAEGEIRVDDISRDRDQLWAEALVRFEQGLPWHIDSHALREAAEEQQESRMMIGEDPWLPILTEWLRAPSWPTPSGQGERSIVDIAQGCTTTEVLLGTGLARRDNLGRRDETRMGLLLREIGFEVRRVKQGSKRSRLYFLPAPVGHGLATGEK